VISLHVISHSSLRTQYTSNDKLRHILHSSFLTLNAPLLASAAVEKLLGLIMSHNGTQLTDKHFENLVFLKANQWQAD